MSDKARTVVLDNGLRLIGEPSTAHQSAAVGYFVKTGARDETPAESGISHFLEHMLFKGTHNRTALEVTYALGNLGVQANAYTSEETTVYYGAVTPGYFKPYQELLSDMLRPSLLQEEFDVEKQVILEEIALYEDRPHFFLFDKALADFFKGHPSGNSVLGSTQSVGALTQLQMQDYFNRRYLPSNMVLVAAGNFDWDQFVSDATTLTADWEQGEAKREVSPFEAEQRSATYSKKDLQQSHLAIFAPGVSATDDDRYPLSVLSYILGDSRGSRLYWELVEPGIAESAGADSEEREGTGCFMAYASMEPDRIEQVSEIVHRVLNNAGDFSEEELERARRKMAARIVLNGELPMGRIMALGNQWLYRQELTPLKEVLNKLEQVDKKGILAALERNPLEPLCEYRLEPQST